MDSSGDGSPSTATRRPAASARHGSEKRSQVVIELGAAVTKCGVAREAAPRCCFPTPLPMRRLLTKWPRTPAMEDVRRDAFAFLEVTVVQRLRYPLAGRVVVLCCNANSNDALLGLLSELLTANFRAKAVTVLCSQLCALYLTECTTGIVLDVGFEEVRCVAVEHGRPLLARARYAALGARHVLDELRSEVLAANPSCTPDLLTEAALQDVLLSAGRPQRGQAGDPRSPLGPLGPLAVDGPRCLEMVLDPTRHVEGWCAATPLLEVLLLCSVVLRASVARNVVVCGALSEVPGFLTRLVDRITQQCEDVPRYSALRGLLPALTLSTPPFPARHLGWTGASLAAGVLQAAAAPPPSSAKR